MTSSRDQDVVIDGRMKQKRRTAGLLIFLALVVTTAFSLWNLNGYMTNITKLMDVTQSERKSAIDAEERSEKDETFSLSSSPVAAPTSSPVEAPTSSPVAAPTSSPVSSSTSSTTSSPVSSQESPPASFSACVMLLDDNHRVTEWLAYHYHALPLKHLIVAVDDRSVISPTPIFDEWRKNFGMDIIEWSNSDFLTNIPDFESLTPSKKLVFHRRRQTTFVAECLRYFHKNNHTWVMLTDIDEYLLFGGQPTDDHDKDEAPDYPSIGEEGAIIHFLEQERQRNGTDYSSPCISIPRTLVGTREDSDKIPQHKFSDVLSSSSVNLTRFDTLRYRSHAQQDIHKPYNGLSKAIVDVSRIRYDEIPASVPSIHKPSHQLCKANIFDPCKGESCFLRINHYLGSWESYSYRSNDARWGTQLKGRENYDDKASNNYGTDDDIRPWMDGFVEQNGIEKAEKILEPAGVLEPRPDYVAPEEKETIII